MLVGSREQIVDWTDSPASASERTAAELDGMSGDGLLDEVSDDSTGLPYPDSGAPLSQATLPAGLTPGQAAELRELLDHIHDGLQMVLDDATVNEKENQTIINLRAWQNLLRTQSEIAEWIHGIEDPESGM